MVAIELAASCNPLRKSNASATPTSTIKSVGIVATSALLDHDAADAVGDVLEAVHHLLQVIVDLDAYDVAHRVAVAVAPEQRLDAQIVELVGIVLEPDDLVGDRVQPRRVLAQRAEQRH